MSSTRRASFAASRRRASCATSTDEHKVFVGNGETPRTRILRGHLRGQPLRGDFAEPIHDRAGHPGSAELPGLRLPIAKSPPRDPRIVYKGRMERQEHGADDDSGDPKEAAERSAEQSFLDDVGEASFPASDPPAVWTWDVEPPVEE